MNEDFDKPKILVSDDKPDDSRYSPIESAEEVQITALTQERTLEALFHKGLHIRNKISGNI
ncbi:hypothetical protein QUF72_05140 [Desulfobacterales bacterium HSG2]|nr:hypothetical protein [Desulfobacterales bacterium HSG2]